MSKTLIVSIQKATDGRDYLQVMSGDQISVNIVLIAEKITIKDLRKEEGKKDGKT